VPGYDEHQVTGRHGADRGIRCYGEARRAGLSVAVDICSHPKSPSGAAWLAIVRWALGRSPGRPAGAGVQAGGHSLATERPALPRKESSTRVMWLAALVTSCRRPRRVVGMRARRSEPSADKFGGAKPPRFAYVTAVSSAETEPFTRGTSPRYAWPGSHRCLAASGFRPGAPLDAAD
jgi:hypothetical protein